MSVDTAHRQNTTDWHLVTVVVERVQLNDCHELLLTFLIEPARVGPRSRRGMLSTIMEPLKIDPVPLGASRTQTHKPSGGCVACVLIRPCASRRDTRRERDATRDEHHSPAMPFAHTTHARDGTRDRARGGFRISGRRRRVVVGGASGYYRNYLKCRNRPKTKRAFPHRDQW